MLSSSANHTQKQQLFERYKSAVIDMSIHKQQTAVAELSSSVTDFLCTVDPKLRLNPAIIHVFDVNIRVNPKWNMMAAAKTFGHFEKYALNLVIYPWKCEFWTVKAYSGFFKMQIEPFLCSPELLFSFIGYQFKMESARFELTDPPLTSGVWMKVVKVAFELFVAGIECKIYHDILQAVEMYGGSVETADVYRARCRSHGNVDWFVQLLLKSNQLACNKTELDCVKTSWSCARCSKENAFVADVCQYCGYDDGGYLVPRSTISPVKSSENQSLHRLNSTAVNTVNPSRNLEIHRISDNTCVDDAAVRKFETDPSARIDEISRKANGIQRVIGTTGTSHEKRYIEGSARAGVQRFRQCDLCGMESTTDSVCSQCHFVMYSSVVRDRGLRKLPEDDLLKHLDSLTGSPPATVNSKINVSSGIETTNSHSRISMNYSNSYNIGSLPPGRVQEYLPALLCSKCGFETGSDARVCKACMRVSDLDSNCSLVAATVDLDKVPSTRRTRHVEKTGEDLNVHDVRLGNHDIWQCAWCTFANQLNKDKCKVCRNSRHSRPADPR